MTIANRIPSVGLGTWKIEKEKASMIVHEAIKVGYRAIDCASDYGNEIEVGAGISAALADGSCKREDLFITSKLWNAFHQKNHVRAACEKTLKDLNLKYLDLYLIHFPITLEYVDPAIRYPPGWSKDGKSMNVEVVKIPIQETWSAMEDLVEAGLVKNIGVANFSCALVREVLSFCKIRPFANQVELHPYLVQKKLQDYCKREGVQVTAYSSFGDYSYIPLGMKKEGVVSLMERVEIKQIAARHGKSSAQILLRWATQQGLSIIPKTSNKERLAQNLSVNEFTLTDEDMMQISGLDKGLRFNDPSEYCVPPVPIFD